MTGLEIIADYIISFSGESIAAGEKQQALSHMTDTLGVMQAGVGEPTWASVRDYAKAGASVGGYRYAGGGQQKISEEHAAMLNAIAAHTLDFDDMTPAFFGHPGIIMLPALLTICQEQTVSGSRFCEAFLLGSNICAAIGAAIDWSEYGDGWVSSSHFGVLGGVGACAYALNWSRETIIAALSVAVGDFSGICGNYGSAAKDINAGRAAAKIIFALNMAVRGLPGNSGALEAYFQAAHTGFMPDKLKKYFASGCSVFTSPGVAMKAYPVCGSALNGIEAALQLCSEIENQEDIISVSCRLPCLSMLDKTPPKTPQQAKFSLVYCTALALVKKDIGIGDFDHSAVLDARAVSLMDKFFAQQDDTLRPEKAGIELFVMLRSGKQLRARVETAGGDPESPLSGQDCREKFITACRRRMTAERAEEFYDYLGKLDTIKDVSVLWEYME